MEALSCKGVTKQSNNSQFRKGLKGVGNRFICEVLGLTDSGIQVLWIYCWRCIDLGFIRSRL